jgi:hypothetical protein
MGIIEWVLLSIILMNGYQTYLRQEYWLDRQIAKFIKYVKTLFC